jgi:hypothetical protein
VTLAVATVSVPLDYQWYYNDVPIPGAKNSSYSLSNLQLSDSGSYSVAVSNAGGTTFSSPAHLHVYDSTPARVDAITVEPTRIRFTISINPNSSYAIQTSEDLMNWISITNISSAFGMFEFTDENLAEERRFYRAIEIAP